MLRVRFTTTVYVRGSDGDMHLTEVSGAGRVVRFAREYEAMVKADDGHTYAVRLEKMEAEEAKEVA